MSEFKGTPGPWVVEVFDTIEDAIEAGAFVWTEGEWDATRGRPACVWRRTPGGGETGLPGSIETTEAMARLIAAAPDLLAALTLVATWMRRSSVMDTVGAVGEILRHAEEAIAKAKGEG